VATERDPTIKFHEQGTLQRGLDPEQGMIFVIDGSKALRKAIRDVFGDQAAV
jgi:hypothetical protein